MTKPADRATRVRKAGPAAAGGDAATGHFGQHVPSFLKEMPMTKAQASAMDSAACMAVEMNKSRFGKEI